MTPYRVVLRKRASVILVMLSMATINSSIAIAAVLYHAPTVVVAILGTGVAVWATALLACLLHTVTVDDKGVKFYSITESSYPWGEMGFWHLNPSNGSIVIFLNNGESLTISKGVCFGEKRNIVTRLLLKNVGLPLINHARREKLPEILQKPFAVFRAGMTK